MHLRPRGFGAAAAKTVRWTAKVSSSPRSYRDPLQSSWQDDPFFWSDEPMPPTPDRATLDDGPGEELVGLYRFGNDEEWSERVNDMFAEIEATLTTLICTSEEQEAVDILDLLARLADGDTSFLHSQRHAHPNNSPNWPA